MAGDYHGATWARYRVCACARRGTVRAAMNILRALALLAVACPAVLGSSAARAQEVELVPTATLAAPVRRVAPAARPDAISRAEADRMGRWLESVAGFERDQRRTGAFTAWGLGVGVGIAGALVLTDDAVEDRELVGGLLIGGGVGAVAFGVAMYLITGNAEDMAADYAAADLDDPTARADAVRAAQDASAKLQSEYESTRVVNAVILLVAGGAQLVAAGVIAAGDVDGGEVTFPAVLGGLGVASLGIGLYTLTGGKMPMEHLIDGFTPVEVAPSIGSSAQGTPTFGVAGAF